MGKVEEGGIFSAEPCVRPCAGTALCQVAHLRSALVPHGALPGARSSRRCERWCTHARRRAQPMPASQRTQRPRTPRRRRAQAPRASRRRRGTCAASSRTGRCPGRSRRACAWSAWPAAWRTRWTSRAWTARATCGSPRRRTPRWTGARAAHWVECHMIGCHTMSSHTCPAT